MNMESRMKELRKQRGWSGPEAAEALGMKYHTYRNYEQGLREPSADMLARIADLYCVSVDYLIKKEPADGNDEFYEELQILRDRPDLRALLKSGKSMTPADVRAIQNLVLTLKGSIEHES